ncbi:MAG: flavodoxin domain-containing protein [Candidatus Bathyarchaeia archaeon]
MIKILVIYDSLTGNTAKAAELIAEGAKESGVEVAVRRIGEVSLNEIKGANAVIIGCPTHAFSASKAMKKFLSLPAVGESLKDKSGAIFTSCRITPMALRWLEKTLMKMNFRVLGKLGVHAAPKGREEEACRELGKVVAKKLETEG